MSPNASSTRFVAPLRLRDRCVAIGASIGIALADRPDIQADRLLSHADAAMYQAKRQGKGCYRVFEAAMHTAAVDRMNLEQALRTAITANSLAVHYQPVIDTQTGHVTTFEALARWRHAEGAFIPPDTFIPLAEDSGLIIELGRAVLLQACHQAQKWNTNPPVAEHLGQCLATPARAPQLHRTRRRRAQHAPASSHLN